MSRRYTSFNNQLAELILFNHQVKCDSIAVLYLQEYDNQNEVEYQECCPPECFNQQVNRYHVPITCTQPLRHTEMEIDQTGLQSHSSPHQLS